MNDFIFGTLATEALRLKRVRGLRGGVTHDHRRAPRDPLPGQPVRLALSAGPARACTRAWVYYTTDGSDPAGAMGAAGNGHALPMRLASSEWDTLEWGYTNHFTAEIPAQPAGSLVRYRLGAASPAGEETFADGGAYYAYFVDDDPPPDWARDAIVYQIFVDRFHPGAGRDWLHPKTPAGFYGGTLRGILEKLDYVEELGANALWLTPVFPSPSHHGYDATDLFAIEPRLGTQDDLRALLDGAHARGMRVVLDFVPNHISNRHPIFQDAQRDPASPYRTWFSFHHWPDEYETFFGVKELPQLDLRNAAARQHVLDAARYWLEFGVDGFRVDYAIGPTPDFWAELRRATRAVRPDCWTFGEVVDPPDVQLAFEGALDGCLDFMLLEALRQALAFGRWDGIRLAGFLESHERFFPPSFSRPSFLDNHDMNRFLWAAGGDARRLKLAALLQFTLAGPPVVYYGTEVGLSQVRDVRQGARGLPEESRLPMPWGTAQDAELADYYRRLIAVRRREPALRHGTRELLHAARTGLAYLRRDGATALAAAFNLSEDPLELALPGGWSEIALATAAGVRLSPTPRGASLWLPPLAGALLREGNASSE